MTEEEVSGSGIEFDELRSRGQRAVEAGRLAEAEEAFDRALAWARQHGTDRQADLALCNRAAVAIELRCDEDEVARLRQVLLRNGDATNCLLAAYHISIYYQFSKNHKKSLFYARIAQSRAELLGRSTLLASSHNQLGNALLGETFVEEACGEYEKALELMPDDASVWRARILDNLGYCRILQGRHDEAYTMLYQSLGLLRRLDAERYQVSTRLDLCFAHLETGRYQHARRQGLAALRLAEKTGQVDSVKNALYLLGEAANLSGDLDTASGYFTELQQGYFPGATYLPGFLLAVDVRKLINLHA
jgi:tetratricopeptide (TPR) repeat protein